MIEKNISRKVINKYINDLVFEIKESNIKYDAVIGVLFGGLIVSAPISMMLNIPQITFHVSFYDDKEKRKTPLIKMTNIEKDKKYLLCDDLIDSGNTIDYIIKNNKDYYIDTCVLLQSKKSHVRATYFADFYNGSKGEKAVWVNFGK